MKKFVVLAASLVLFGTNAMAKDINFQYGLSQGEFHNLSKEAGAMIGYRNTAPAEPLGVLGFDAGVETSAMDINTQSSYWKSAFGSDAPSYVFLPKVRARKGLPLSIDVGAMYSFVPGSNIKVWGVEVSKAILDGTLATPALGVRATYTKLAGVGELNMQTAGIDASISKGILFLTPYGGVGAQYINSKAEGGLKELSPNLRSENIWQPRVFAGLKVTPLPFIGITAEAEYQVRPIYSLKAAVSF